MNTFKLFWVACMLMALGIVLGAFAAHGLKESISVDKLAVFETGVKYHLLHALAIVVIAMHTQQFLVKRLKIALVLILLGILFFSGSLYLLSTVEINGMAGMQKNTGSGYTRRRFMFYNWLGNAGAELEEKLDIRF